MPYYNYDNEEDAIKKLLKPTKLKCKDMFITLDILSGTTKINLLSCTDPKNVEDGVVYKRSYDIRCIEGMGGATPLDLTPAIVSGPNLGAFVTAILGSGTPSADATKLEFAAGSPIQIKISFIEEELDIKDLKNCAHGSAHITITNALDIGYLYADNVDVNALSGTLITIPVVLCLHDMDIKCNSNGSKTITLLYNGVLPVGFIPVNYDVMQRTANLSVATAKETTQTGYDVCFTFKGTKHKEARC